MCSYTHCSFGSPVLIGPASFSLLLSLILTLSFLSHALSLPHPFSPSLSFTPSFSLSVFHQPCPSFSLTLSLSLSHFISPFDVSLSLSLSLYFTLSLSCSLFHPLSFTTPTPLPLTPSASFFKSIFVWLLTDARSSVVPVSRSTWFLIKTPEGR